MLELRSNCEHCGKELPNSSTEAMICSYECTYCKDCVDQVLFNVCPNCGGGFEKRPIRPLRMLAKDPAATVPKLNPLDVNAFYSLLMQYRDIAPDKR